MILKLRKQFGFCAIPLFLLLVVATRATQQNNAVPETLPGADTHIYKTVGETPLRLHVYEPPGRKTADKLPAIVFFFGGGWRNGTPAQFVEQCKHLAARGMVAITAEYRVKSRHNVSPLECIADAKSAIRWVRQNATKLGIDPNRIAAGGGSAGGHLAAAAATVQGFQEQSEDLSISAVPNALVLFNPALDVTSLPADYGFGPLARAASPLQQVRGKLPPTIILHGTADKSVPFEQATKFCAAMKQQGNACEVKAYEGRDHSFFNFGRGNGEDFKSTLQATDDFLVALGYLKGKLQP